MISSDGTNQYVQIINGSVLADGENQINCTVVTESRPALYSGTWHYLKTYYYDTKTQGEIQSIAMTLIGFMPYVGAISSVIYAIECARNIGAPVMYVKVDEYYIDGYSQYKYYNYYYSDAARTNLLYSTVEIKQMW